jgi:hypothetical protein
MLHPDGIILRSGSDAYTCVIEDSDGTEEWCIRRAAVKLGGPLGRMLFEGQPFDWDTLRSVGEYHTDYEEAMDIFRIHLKLPQHFGFDEQIDRLMNQASALAVGFIQPNQSTLARLADASEGVDQFPRDEIVAVIQAQKLDG